MFLLRKKQEVRGAREGGRGTVVCDRFLVWRVRARAQPCPSPPTINTLLLQVDENGNPIVYKKAKLGQANKMYYNEEVSAAPRQQRNAASPCCCCRCCLLLSCCLRRARRSLRCCTI